MRITLMSALSIALVSVGATSAQADQPYYNPANGASSTGFTTDYELYRTIGCPGKGLLDTACSTPAPAPVVAAAPAPEPVTAPAATAPEPTTPAAAPVAEPAPAPVVTKAQPMVLKGVHFDFNSANLRPESYAILDQAVATLKQNKFPATELAGYTDSIGSDKYNQKLSERRVMTVKRYMVDAGYPADSLTTKGFGEADPIADNKTKVGRFENRRVELHIK